MKPQNNKDKVSQGSPLLATSTHKNRKTTDWWSDRLRSLTGPKTVRKPVTKMKVGSYRSMTNSWAGPCSDRIKPIGTIKNDWTLNFHAKFSTPNILWTLISAKFNLQSRHWTLNRNRGLRGFSGSKAVMAMPVRSVRSHLVQTDPKKQNFSPELILRSIKIRPRSKIVF